MTEARIRIGNTELSFGQSMSLRVAIGNMLIELAAPAYRKALGPIGDGYRARLAEVQNLIHGALNTSGGSLDEPAA